MWASAQSRTSHVGNSILGKTGVCRSNSFFKISIDVYSTLCKEGPSMTPGLITAMSKHGKLVLRRACTKSQAALSASVLLFSYGMAVLVLVQSFSVYILPSTKSPQYTDAVELEFKILSKSKLFDLWGLLPNLPCKNQFLDCTTRQNACFENIQSPLKIDIRVK